MNASNHDMLPYSVICHITFDLCHITMICPRSSLSIPDHYSQPLVGSPSAWLTYQPVTLPCLPSCHNINLESRIGYLVIHTFKTTENVMIIVSTNRLLEPGSHLQGLL